MPFRATSLFSSETHSLNAGRRVAEGLAERFGRDPLASVLVYATMNHDPQSLLRGFREVLGKEPSVLGSSTQGVVTRNRVSEHGYALGAMGFGGSTRVGVALEGDVQRDTAAKGRSMGVRLREQLGGAPAVVVLHYDPLCGLDVPTLLDGLYREVSCPIVGGASGHQWGRMIKTFQYFGERVCSKAVVAAAYSGDFVAEVGLSHGTSPAGVTSKVTRAEGNLILEIDGRPALDVLREMTSCSGEIPTSDECSSWPLGLRHEDPGSGSADRYVVRAVFGFDTERGGVVVQAAIAEGSTVMFHHRTVDGVLSGTEEMANELLARLGGRRPLAVLGFECGARTAPFLGADATLQENRSLQESLAPDAPWLGMVAWGEVGPLGARPAFHNYTYPLLVFAEERAVEPV